MKILLTGACGYVGSALLPKLEAAGHEVTGLDIGWFRKDERVVELDVRRYPGIGAEWDAIIHLAAISNDPSVSYYHATRGKPACWLPSSLPRWPPRLAAASSTPAA